MMSHVHKPYEGREERPKAETMKRKPTLFFFQAEDGIRDADVTGVQTCALPISEEGMPYGVVLSLVDVTDRRRIEREREQDLRDALARFKVLSGVLSICASCKRIRDPETARWSLLEVYLREHSEAELSHGLCGECAEATRRQIQSEDPGTR